MHYTDDEPQDIIPQKPPPPPRREAEQPIDPSGPIETPIPQHDPVVPIEVPQKPAAPREASASRPPPSRRDRAVDGRAVIPPRGSEPEVISRRNVVPMGRAAAITTAALPLAAGDRERTSGLRHLDFPSLTRRR